MVKTTRPSRTRKSKAAACFLALLISCGQAQQGADTAENAESSSKGGESVTVYSGREEELVGPILARFEKGAGIDVNVKYGSTAELAALLAEEGDRSRADLFFAQDAGALGAIAKKGLFSELPSEVLSRVPEQFRSQASEWVGITGRARTVVFNEDELSESDLPSSILAFSDPKWKDRIGWAPTNGSFQAFVTALRKIRGDAEARQWLEDLKANNAKTYPANVPIVQAVANGEIDVGFVNHYYAVQLRKDNPNLKARNYFFRNGDPGGLVNVSGAGILRSSEHKDNAQKLLEYLLSAEGQRYWASQEFEYPLVPSVDPAAGLPPLSELNPPDVQLSELDDLEGTLKMLQEVGLT